jgi:predicted TIM-barrel fold metal-dependent hydrolase
VWDVLKTNIYLDAVVYGEAGLKAAVQASGADRLMFGTDHPFFPPLEEGETEWLSVRTNEKAVKGTFGDDGEETVEAVMGGNAVRVLNLTS